VAFLPSSLFIKTLALAAYHGGKIVCFGFRGSGRQILAAMIGTDFEIIGEIREIQKIAVRTSIQDIKRLRRMYGPGRWRKMKGIARVRLQSGRIRSVLQSCTGTKLMV